MKYVALYTVKEFRLTVHGQGVHCRMVLVVNFFVFFIFFFCFVVAMGDLVHDVIAIFHLP